MIFYYEKNTDRFILATNIRAVSEFSGLPYHKVYNWLVDTDIHKDEEVLCVRSEIVRGKQRIQNGTKVVKGNIDTGSTNIIETGEPKAKQKRKTEQPDSRDMKGFDDFFKEVK